MGNQERGIIGPSEKDIREVNNPNRQPSFWTKVSRSPLVRGAVGVLGLGTLGVADVSCVSPKTVEVRPTTTPIPIGGPEFSQITDPEIKEIAERLANPETRSQVPQEDIESFNNWEIAHKISAEATATAEAQKTKPLPDVINNQNTNFVQLPPSEIQTLTNTPEGKGKTPLPDIVKNDSSISVSEVTNTGGFKELAIVSTEKGVRTYSLPALKTGRIASIRLTVSGELSSSTLVGVDAEDGSSYSYIVPDSSSSNFKLGDWVQAGQLIITFTYTPGSPQVNNFIGVTGSYKSGIVPEGTIALMSSRKGLSTKDILALQNAVVVVGPQGKG